MDITKVKSKDGQIEVYFRRENGKDQEVTGFASKDEPRPELPKAFASLANDFLAMCDLPGECRKGTEVISVSIGEKQGIPNYILSARRTTEAGTYAISTPLFHDYEEDTGAANGIATTTLKKIEKLVKAAAAFVAGERTQRNLFEGDEAAEG